MKTYRIADVRQMKDCELYQFFQKEFFYDDPALTAAVCQELENREAARAGRPPALVVFEKLGPRELGYAGYKNGTKIIALNQAYLRKSAFQHLTPAMAMNTIFHEGRHIWQYCVLENDDQRVPLSVRLLLRADNLCYTNGEENVIDVGISPDIQGYLEYFLQENEMDARFYALKRMTEAQRSAGMGVAFQIGIEKVKADEIRWIRNAINHFDEGKYRLLEQKRLEMYKHRAEARFRERGEKLPELPENFRCCRNFWMIHHVICPVFSLYLSRMKGLRKNTMMADELLLGLYTIARKRAEEGRPLETPNELLKIAMDSELSIKFSLKQDAIPKEWGKPLGM